MADFDHNPRGGLTTNRESLHASAEYKRQVAALEQMRKSEMDERMTTMAQVPSDHPLMIAWEAHKQTDAYANSKKWATHPQYLDGPLRALFEAGFRAAHLAQPAQAVDATGRSAKDYAIEHAGYLAASAKRLIDAINDYAMAQQNSEVGEGGEGALHAAEESLSEASGAVRDNIYEFEKRRTRAIGNAQAVMRAEKSEALLREAECELRGSCLSRESARISQDIRTHLSEPRT